MFEFNCSKNMLKLKNKIPQNVNINVKLKKKTLNNSMQV